MGLVGPLFGFGFGIIAFGFFFQLFEEIIEGYFGWMILNNEYYELADLIWHSLPFLAVIIGVFCIIAAGVIHRSSKKEVVYE